MPASDKDLINETGPTSSFENHRTATGIHDEPPPPENLAGPSMSHFNE
jgi:hypothetical protein